MNQKTLFKIALTCSILGVLSLFLITELIELPESSVKEIEQIKEEGDTFRIKGKIKDIQKREKITFLTVETVDEIQLTSFDKIEKKKGSNIDLIGEIQEYKGRKSFLVKEIN